MILFCKHEERIRKKCISTSTDAAFSISSNSEYRRTGILCGIEFETRKSDPSILHGNDQFSQKHLQICCSSYEAKFLACTVGDDQGYALIITMQSIFRKLTTAHIVNVDFRGSYDTISTLHDGREYCLRITVSRIITFFETLDINALRFLHFRANIDDALTKSNLKSHTLLNEILRTGYFSVPLHESFELDSKQQI